MALIKSGKESKEWADFLRKVIMNELQWRMIQGEAEWIEVIAFKGCIIIWRIQRMCLCPLPTHFAPVWMRHAGEGGRRGGVHTTACPCITHRTSFPPYRGLCGYCMYMMERCRWTRMQIALVLPQVSVFFDKDDSWLTSLCPSASLEKTHVFSPFQE